jgi:hypothetical protein
MKKIMRALVGGIGAAGGVGKGLFGKLKDDEEEKKKGTVTPATTSAPTTMKKGGYVKAADGCAKKGKTKGRMV